MFRMTFDFEDREPTDVAHANATLSALRLSDLALEDSEGYLAARTDYDPDTHRPMDTRYYYGFDRLVLSCENDGEEVLHTYQVDAQAFPKGRFASTDAFHDLWRSEHPDRAMRTLIHYDFGEADAFVVLHHERADA